MSARLQPGAALRPRLDLAAVVPRREWRRTVLRFGLFGPLIGGAPYNLFLFPIPFAYAIGLAPALVCGALYAQWRDAPARRAPGIGERMLFGALCGLGAAVACSVAAVRVGFIVPLETALLVLAAHGAPAGAVLGWLTPARGANKARLAPTARLSLSASRTSSAAPAPAWPATGAA